MIIDDFAIATKAVKIAKIKKNKGEENKKKKGGDANAKDRINKYHRSYARGIRGDERTGAERA